MPAGKRGSPRYGEPWFWGFCTAEEARATRWRRRVGKMLIGEEEVCRLFGSGRLRRNRALSMLKTEEPATEAPGGFYEADPPNRREEVPGRDQILDAL